MRAVFRFLMMATAFLAATTSCLASGSMAETRELETFSLEPAMRVETLNAYTRADTYMNLVSEAADKVIEVRADVGEHIPEDGVFAVLDPTFMQIDLDQLDAEEKRLESSKKYYLTEARRYRNLVASRHSDQSSLDKLEHSLEQYQIQIAELHLRRAELREKLRRYTIIAPKGYTVIERYVEPGEWVTVGQKLARLGDYQTLVAPFALDPLQYQWLKANQGALTLRASGGYGRPPIQVPARLKQVSPAFDEETRKINVELSLSPEGLEARGGLHVELDVSLPDRAGTFVAPASAVIERYEEFWLMRPDSSMVKVVLLGPDPGGGKRISAPELQAGERFLLDPAQLKEAKP